MNKIVYLNGKYIKFKSAKISIEDRGFQFSDSVYEVIAVRNNNFIDINFHLKRLRRSLNQINIKYIFKYSDLIKIFLNLIKKNKLKSGLIYLQITRGVQERSHSYIDGLTPTIVIYTIVKNFKGGPVGLDTIGVAISENPHTVEEVYEPFLIQEGYIQRTTRGRVALEKAFEYLNVSKDNMNLFK